MNKYITPFHELIALEPVPTEYHIGYGKIFFFYLNIFEISFSPRAEAHRGRSWKDYAEIFTPVVEKLRILARLLKLTSRQNMDNL
jgi:hypothetical protein